MTIQQLQQTVDSVGVAKAVVFLKREHVAESSGATKIESQLDADGRMKRTLPPLNTGAVEALEQHFVASPDGKTRPMVHFPFLEAVHGVVDQKGLDRLANHDATHSLYHAPELSLIQPVASEAADAPPAGPAWGISRLKAPEIWKRGFTGRKIVVAHLDSGADSRHAALLNALEKVAAFDANGHGVQPPTPYADLDNHGTHTAGTLAGRHVTGEPIVGMAPDVELVDATIVGGADTVSRALAGMNWALEKGARVMSLSVGFNGYDASFLKVIDQLRALHLLPVVAIGNGGPNSSCSPGNYATVLSVGASNDGDYVAQMSSSPAPGEDAVGPTVCAPGFRILSAKPGGGYRLSSGTSMATPHVAGLAALLFSAKPGATIDEVQQAIVNSCSDPMKQGAERAGAGIPDGVVALEQLLSGAA
jgi:subtilisin